MGDPYFLAVAPRNPRPDDVGLRSATIWVKKSTGFADAMSLPALMEMTGCETKSFSDVAK
jgi:hypothetical protein